MKVRINNIECRLLNGHYEIVKWFPNEYYNAEQKLIEEGYKKITYENGDWSMKNGSITITGSCFKNPESCCVIAWLRYDGNEFCTDLESVGDRLLKLNKKEREDFFTVYELADRLIVEEGQEAKD